MCVVEDCVCVCVFLSMCCIGVCVCVFVCFLVCVEGDIVYETSVYAPVIIGVVCECVCTGYVIGVVCVCTSFITGVVCNNHN